MKKPTFGTYPGTRQDPRQFYRKQPGCQEAVIQVIGANCLVHATTGLSDTSLFLLQKRDDGKYGAIGGASDLFIDDEGNVIAFEEQQDTLQREFYEETGHLLQEGEGFWKYLGCFTSRINYSHYPSVHGVGTYFSIETTSERIHEYASKGGSREGKVVILNTKEVLQALQDGQVFPNTEPALRKLLQIWCVLPN